MSGIRPLPTKEILVFEITKPAAPASQALVTVEFITLGKPRRDADGNEVPIATVAALPAGRLSSHVLDVRVVLPVYGQHTLHIYGTADELSAMAERFNAAPGGRIEQRLELVCTARRGQRDGTWFHHARLQSQVDAAKAAPPAEEPKAAEPEAELALPF